MLGFFLQPSFETFLIVRKNPRDINLRRSSYKVPVILAFNVEFSRQAFEIYSNIKFHANSESSVFPCGQTLSDGQKHDEVNCRFLQFF
jgi:hypothetical protein